MDRCRQSSHPGGTGRLTDAIRTFADLRKHIYVRDNILGIVNETFTGFPFLIPHAIVDKVLERPHILGAQKGLKTWISRLNFLSFGDPCCGLLPYSFRNAL